MISSASCITCGDVISNLAHTIYENVIFNELIVPDSMTGAGPHLSTYHVIVAPSRDYYRYKMSYPPQASFVVTLTSSHGGM